MDSRYASRKFILACFVLLAALGLVLGDVLDAGQWMSISTWVLGLYYTGNIAERVTRSAAMPGRFAEGGGVPNGDASMRLTTP